MSMPIRPLSEFAVAHADDIGEIELNPVIVHAEGQGLSIADAMVVFSKPEGMHGRG